MELDGYSFVLLKRGPRASSTEEELDRLQEQHLAHLDAMREQGHLLLAGPFSDQADETLRGFCLYRTSVEETRRLVESDPSVQAVGWRSTSWAGGRDAARSRASRQLADE